MKLLLCTSCHDIVAIHRGDWRSCQCGLSSGRYLSDGHNAEVRGAYVETIGMANPDIQYAINKLSDAHGEYGPGIRSWIFPHDYHRIARLAGSSATDK